MYQRIDPVGCGCTDCIIGYSVPLDWANAQAFDGVAAGTVTDASCSSDRDFDYYSDRNL